MIFKKYQRNTLVVGVTAISAATAGDYGDLGVLVNGDLIITLPSGELTTRDPTSFASKFTLVNDSAVLTGDDDLWF